MTAHEITMPDAIPVNPIGAGKLKTAKLRDGRQQRSFQDVLEKAEAEPQRTVGEGRRNALQVALEPVPPSRAAAVRVQTKTMAADELLVVASLQQRRFADPDVEETDGSDRRGELEDAPGSEKSDSVAVSLKLEQMIAGLLPAQPPATAVRSAGPVKDAPSEPDADPSATQKCCRRPV